MVLMTCQLKKTTKSTNNDFTVYEHIELDSLESATENIESEDINKKLKCLDLSGLQNLENGLTSIEDVFRRKKFTSLENVDVLKLRLNHLQIFPFSILNIPTLVYLDLSHNQLITIPHEIGQLKCLRELIIDYNCVSVLPESLWFHSSLRVLRVSHNSITVTPDRLADMRAFILSIDPANNIDNLHTDLQTDKPPNKLHQIILKIEDGDKTIENASKTVPLGNLSLRSNRLKGNIILGNYGNLTELDVSENAIESLDLSAVDKLQVIQCSRNSLVHLSLHGKNLTSLIAGNNKLTKLSVVYAPTNLRHIDVSYNELDQLPEWLSCCHELRSLFASHNILTSLPDHLFCNEMPYLQTLQLAYNKLHSMPNLPRRLPLQELFLQNNSLSILPDNFFRALNNIRVLNLSNNRLCELPVPEENCPLEKLYLTANCLTDKTMNRIGAYLLKMRVFHGAYNSFTSLPEDCSTCWPDIEELVLSGNKILRLPESINSLYHLTVLRVHSNLLQSCPQLCNLTSLRALDLAHNQLDRVDLLSLVPPNLKFLDLSCNLNLHVDSQQFQNYKQQRPMSLVDVSGKNRTTLPLIPSPFCENDSNNETNWTVGFSETAGCKQRLYISQVRLPAFCNTEALFGIFDGENNNIIPVTVDKVVPRILLEERTVKETANEYMKYTMLSAHRELKDKSQKSGMSAIIIHILKSKISTNDYTFCGGTRKYILRAASVGEVRAVIGRSNSPIKVLSMNSKKQSIKTNPHCQLIVPDPEVTEMFLDEQDEFMIIANKNVWDVMSYDSAVAEVRSQRNVILAAKRLQDLAQAYGAEDNISVIVVRFNIVKSDVDQLMRELRQTIRKNKYQSGGSTTTTTAATICQGGCCCETNNSCVHCLEKNHLSPNDDRSSPSGQSDHACSDCNSSAKLFIHHLSNSKQNDMNRLTRGYDISEQKISPERQSYRGVAKAVRAKREEDSRSREETDSALSEEQFKCWEYMLEQNTQMLFDKELNTISRGFRRHQPFPLMKSQSSLSRSSPHLADPNPLPAAPLLTRHFGSTRSFNPLPTRPSRYTAERRQLIGGPHAAYFGSLQRLMPYNLEYDFAVIQERGLADSMELDRMNQYWGVTTTEL